VERLGEQDKGKRWYKAREFAGLTGLTVRTLHHYDRLGLLRAARRTAAGYRLYTLRDLARLEQIVALKFIGFSLNDIKTILVNPKNFDLAEMLRLQREIMTRKRACLDSVIAAIERAESIARKRGSLDLTSLKRIIEVINVQSNTNWMMQYYSDEARRKLEERAKDWTPEKQAKVSADWAALFKDVDAAMANHVDPTSKRARRLAKRWDELIGRFTGDDPEIVAGLEALYADQPNWPGTFQKPFDEKYAAFIRDAKSHTRKEK